MAKKTVAEILKKQLIQKLVAQRNVDRLKAEGYKVVDIKNGNLDKKLLDNLNNNQDLVLMEKEI